MKLQNVEDIYVLSSMQQGILFHILYEDQAQVYFSQFVCTIEQPLNRDTFFRAWRHMLTRHSVLRTAFLWDGLDEPLQVVSQQVELPCTYLDWREIPEMKQQTRLEAFLAADRARGFDLAVAPLWRLFLIQTANQTYTFISSSSHILMDGWSRALLLQEVSVYYNASLRGQTPHLPRAHVYRNYIGWLQRQDLTRAEDYWKAVLQGFATPLTLGKVPAVIKSVGNEQKPFYARAEFRLSTELTTALQTFTRQQQLTLNTLVQGAWAILLSHYTGTQDIVFGVTVAGRPASLPGSDTMVGLFINTLPLRVDISSHVHLASWLKSLQEQQSAMLEYQYTPLVQIRGWSDVPHDQQLFESILVFENTLNAVSWEQADELYFRDMRGGVEHTNYPLTLTVGPDSELFLRLAYDASRFEAEETAGMLKHLRNLLAHMVANPGARLSDLSLLSIEERDLLLGEWNQTQHIYPSQSIQELFEEQAGKSPDAIAVVCEQEQMSYQELNRRANQLAHALRALGVTAEQRVGLCLDTSLDLVISVLAILKAGATYLPLDPSFPVERLAFLLRDAQACLLLTQHSLLPLLASLSLPRLCLDQDWPQVARQPETSPTTLHHPALGAYVLYTSGSTGQPKGVLVEQRALLNYLQALQSRLGPEPMGCCAMVQPLTVDFCLSMFFPPLLTGGQLHLIAREHAIDAAALARTLRQRPADSFKIAPSHLAALLTGATAADLLPRRFLIVGGEASSWPWTQELCGWLPAGAQLVNHYGPTETTVGVLTYRVEVGAPTPRGESTPLGRPLANIQTYVLDRAGRLLPPGIVGELYLAGANLARGYLGRPDLTAERFVPHPWSREPGARLYRTGDLVRQRTDGTLEFVGRIDEQIKLRGYRIELGEIEAVLRQHEQVREALVLAREAGQAGEKRLVGYVVLHEGSACDRHALRDWLQRQLPMYMVPTSLVLLDALPLLPHGKVDRRRLPAPEFDQQLLDEDTLLPRNPVEEMLIDVWKKTLGIKQVGVHSNFFEAGGHSLLAIRTISHLRKLFHRELPLRSLFEAPTPSALAAYILEQLQETHKELQAPPLVRVARSETLPLSFAQQRLWFLDQLEPGISLYNVQATLLLKGPLDIAAFERSIQEIVRRHDILRTTFIAVDNTPQQRIASDISVPLPVINLQDLSSDAQQVELRRLAVQEARQSFDLAYGKLLRVTLLRLTAQKHMFFLTLHHIVSDEWSLEIFWRELDIFYRAYAHGEPSLVPELPIQYADFAHWQRQWLQGEVLQTQLDYWREQLRGAPPMLGLPTDHQRPTLPTFQGGTVPFQLSKQMSEALKELSLRESVTLFMTLLAAFQTLLARYTRLEDIVVGTPITNRARVETENLIGFFLNTLVLRTDLSGNPTFQELLRRVREVALQAYTHQDLPFEKLVDELSPERALSRNPLFQVMFILHDDSPESFKLADLTLETVFIERDVTKFDLTLVLGHSSNSLEGMFAYNCDLFEVSTIERLAQHFQILLEGIVANPQQRICELPLLTASERRSLQEWNSTKETYPYHIYLHEMVEAQVERTPDAIALVWEHEQVSYQELNRRANQLAHWLQRQGIGLETRVGVCLERTADLVVSLLAVLKAGGTYVPLDPTYPEARLAFMLADSQANLVLTQPQLRSQLPTSTQGVPSLVCLEEVREQIKVQPVTNLAPSLHPEQSAYLIYTSGSTGQAKGVAIRYRSVTNLLSWAQATYSVQDLAGVLAATSICFDLSIFELWVPLSKGGSVILAENLLQVPRLPARSRITLFNTVPSVLNELLRAEGLPASTRVVNLAGEALPASLVEQLYALGTVEQVYNLYAPSETTTYSTASVLPRNLAGQIPSIGRPIANTHVYLLDDSLQPVPIGVVGEVYLGGMGVARGYWHHPELTAERFVPHPFATEPGERLYRTGDLARYRRDGHLEFIGRRDSQVKVRGFRIEVGEIEAVLRQHEEVREALVVAREQEGGGKRLVGYVVLREGSTCRWEEVRGWLQRQLPAYMVPTVLVVLDALPLTPHGKVDRSRLPDPIWESVLLQDDAEPVTPYEKILSDIWAEVLDAGRVGIHTNFFQAGGDSILTLLIIARARSQGLIITPKQVFQYQTIAELAVAVEREMATAFLSEEQEQGTVPFLPWQSWFFEQQFSDPHHANQVVCLEIAEQCLTREVLKAAIARLIERHSALRLRFARRSQGWEQYIAPLETRIDLLVDVLDVSMLSVAEQTLAIAEATRRVQATLNLETGPLLRAIHVTRHALEPELLLLIAHPLAVDNVSWHILLEDLERIYNLLVQGIATPIPPEAPLFKKWCERLYAYANSPGLFQEMSHWTGLAQHQDASLLPLDFDVKWPTDLEIPRSYTYRSLEVEETRALLQDVPVVYHTQTQDLLLTALLLAFAPWLGRYKLLVNLAESGRQKLFSDIDVSHTVGQFTSVYPVLLDLEHLTPSPLARIDLGQALKALKEQLHSIPQHGSGYRGLRFLHTDHTTRLQLAAIPHPWISFSFLGALDDTQRAGSAGWRRLPQVNPGSLFSDQGQHLLDVCGFIADGRLHMYWQFNERTHRISTIELLAERCLERLRTLITYCCTLDTGSYTPSDFPELGLSQAMLDKALGKLRPPKKGAQP